MRNGGLLPTKGHFWVTCAASEKKIELATSRSAFLNPFGLRTPFYSQCVKTPKTFVYVGNMCSNKLFQKLKLTHLKSTSLWIWDNKIKPITSWHLFWESNCKFPKTNKKSRQKSDVALPFLQVPLMSDWRRGTLRSACALALPRFCTLWSLGKTPQDHHEKMRVEKAN